MVARRKTSPEVRRVSRRDQEERAAQCKAWRSAEGAGMVPSFLEYEPEKTPSKICIVLTTWRIRQVRIWRT